jgi:hypothetical protein
MDAVGEIVEVGNRIDGGERGHHTAVPVRARSHDTPGGEHEIAAGPTGAIGLVIAHRFATRPDCALQVLGACQHSTLLF